jgi:hypothetical protein
MFCGSDGPTGYEMRYLFELCKFKVLAEYSDFRRSNPQYAAEQVWVVAPA